MKKNIIVSAILLTGLAISLVSYTNKSNVSAYEAAMQFETTDGETLFKAKCSVCHVTSKPEDMSTLIAPPMVGVIMHVKNGVEGKNKTEKRQNAIDFIVDYAQYPSAEKSMFGAHAIERFNVMPSQKDNVTEEELIQIANYLYDNFPSKGMKHGKGKKGSCGNGCGSKCNH